MNLALVVLLPFIGAALPPLMIRMGRTVCASATGGITLLALALLSTEAPTVLHGGTVSVRYPWIPSLGLDASFFLDGLSLFFAVLILGMGLLIILYARFYLGREDAMGRFYAYLLLFQGAMVGIVLSGNILFLLVFWELTSLSSFLLIGFWRHLPESRQGARMALVVTGGGGLALIAGMLILGSIAGSYEIPRILERAEEIQASPLFMTALLLVLLGAFTKSAQFPFHFWLPHAMAAPTPVSAYLHSATMVKAGLFLMARLWPAMAGTEAWFLIVSITGLLTMVMAAWIALFKDDIKALLAFSTVSHLGLITMLLGMGTRMAATAAMFHILNHATFKAALFLSAGIVDHETGTRDIRRLGGLAAMMPITATLACVAAASMAGVPFFNGYLSKEMMLEEAAHTVYAGSEWLFPVLATLGALLSAAYSARFAIALFFGRRPDRFPHQPHDPPFGMWLPVAILVVPVVLIGLLPDVLATPVVAMTAGAVVGEPLTDLHLAIWHGLTPAFVMSLIALGGGLVLFLSFEPANQFRLAFPRPEAKGMFQATIEHAASWCRIGTQLVHSGSFQRYLAAIIGTSIALGVAGLMPMSLGEGDRELLPLTPPAVVAWLLVIAASIMVALRHHDRLLALVLTSVVGLVVSLGFLHLSAPDLALTQISVEVVTTILLLLALNLLPKVSPRESGTGRRVRDAVIAAIAGLGTAGLAYAMMTRSFETISDYHVEQAKPGGGGSNVVNVILVDFRGFDTFGEIIVLGIAALAIYALLHTAVRGVAGRRLAGLETDVEAKDAHPLILVVVTRVLLPLALVVGAYIFFRGHNMPGGGFIAGLVVGIAFLMQYIASGFAWASERSRFDYHGFIGLGVGIAGLTGIASWLFGAPFLTSAHTGFDIPIIGHVELASAMAFDLGVFLTVVGVVMLSLSSLSRVERGAERRAVHPGPMDIELRAAATKLAAGTADKVGGATD